METIAVYWEPRIKTYGFDRIEGLSMVGFSCDAAGAGELGRMFREEEAGDTRFLLILGTAQPDGRFRFHLVVQRELEDRVLDLVRRASRGSGAGSARVRSPVGLIRFQGPHFGERYGIADAVGKALAGTSIEVLAAACSAASVFLVLPEDRMREAVALLSVPFDTPESARPRDGSR